MMLESFPVTVHTILQQVAGCGSKARARPLTIHEEETP
jgi:hypothetical protein